MGDTKWLVHSTRYAMLGPVDVRHIEISAENTDCLLELVSDVFELLFHQLKVVLIDFIWWSVIRCQDHFLFPNLDGSRQKP